VPSALIDGTETVSVCAGFGGCFVGWFRDGPSSLIKHESAVSSGRY
jgi:hypothetical protein